MLKFLKNRLYVLTGLIALAFILYYPALFNDYVWDDIIIFVDRDFWREGHSIWYMISQPVLEGASYFRPLVFLSFVTEFKLVGLKPFVSHLINIIILIINSVLVYFLSHRLAILLNKEKPYIYSFIVSILYITSPILIESTVWVVGRFDLMVTTFILMGVLIYIKFSSSLIRDFCLSLVFILALFSKELAVVFPLIIFMIGHFFIEKKGFLNGLIGFIKQEKILIILLGIAFALYMLIRFFAMKQIYHAVNENLSDELLAIEHIRILFPLNTFYEYTKAFFVPFYPNVIHQIDYAFLADWRGKLASIFSIFTIMIIINGVVRKANFSAYMAFCALLCILPVMRIIPLGVPETIIHERFMTTALFFFLMSIVFLPWDILFNKLNVNRVKIPLLSTLVIFYSIFGIMGIHVTLPMWKNNLILWKWAYENNKDSDIALQSYLIYLYDGKSYKDFVKIIDERRSEITMSSEVLYYAYLLEHRDPETKKYIDGMINSLNPLHRIVADRSEYHPSDVRLTEIGSIYHLNAYYYITMGDDLNEAAKNIDIALWYDPQNKQYMLLKSLILEGLDNAKDAEVFWKKATSNLHISKLNQFNYQKKNVIKIMCEKKLAKNPKICNS